MTEQPFYHLRPNKNIDRNLFVQTLLGLSRIYHISQYQYTGFGSYLFDDFKLLHNTLNISHMTSLERDPVSYERAKFNVPYHCIHIKNIGSHDYITNLNVKDNSHNIFWLDFVCPSEINEQLNDYATLLSALNSHDIVRITVNANSASLGKNKDKKDLHEYRLEQLKERITDEYLPVDIKPTDMNTQGYPLVLLKILKTVVMRTFTEDPSYNTNFLFPLFSSVYADGQPMLTFLGIVLNSHREEKKIKDALKDYPHNNFKWDDPCKIQIPPLSMLEITEINKMLPNQKAQQHLMHKFPFIFPTSNLENLKSYISYYKYYPNYHQISF